MSGFRLSSFSIDETSADDSINRIKNIGISKLAVDNFILLMGFVILILIRMDQENI